MSDMNTPEVPAEEPAAAPAVEAEAAKPVEEPTPLGAISEKPTDTTPVVTQQPSNEDVKPEKAPERERLSLKDAARVVTILVRGHRTIGDAELGAAIDDLEAALPADADEA